jgi:hypothetical protein
MRNNSKISGILSIISGGIGVIESLFMFALTAMVPMMMESFYASDIESMAGVLGAIYVISGIFNLIVSILAIVGGIYALKRKYWGMGLAGAIASILVFFFTGVPALIFIILGRKEYSQGSPVPPQPV